MAVRMGMLESSVIYVWRKAVLSAMEKQVRFLLDNPQEGWRMGQAAYKTIVHEWNAQEAARRLLDFYEQFQKGKIVPPATGPFSEAEVISPKKMYSYMMEKGRKLIYEQ